MKSFKKNKKVKVPGTFKKQNNNKKPAKPSDPKLEQLQLDIKLLREDVRPMILEKEAIQESKDSVLISCDASWTKKSATIAFVIRSIAFKDSLKVSRPTNAHTSNEAEL